jgi:putative phosphoesterase
MAYFMPDVRSERMLLGVVSDTHGHVANTQRAIRMLSSLQVEQVLHCGDIGSESIVWLFADWPTHFVFGNVDHDQAELTAAIAACGQHSHGRFGRIELEGCTIALMHGDDTPRLRETIHSGEYELVCYGHTHQPEQHRVGRTQVLNPGALYRASQHTIAVVRLPEMEVTHIPL